MIDVDINQFKGQLSSNRNKIVLFGAGKVGELALYSCNQLGIPVHFFCDSKKEKQNSKFLNIETISPEKLKELGNEVIIFIAHNNALSTGEQLKKKGFKKVYNCNNLFRNLA